MKAGLADVPNAIWVIMGEQGCSEQEARRICEERIRVETAKYVLVVEATQKRTDLCDDVKRYVEVMQYSLSGNLVWSIQCPRYNKAASFNELQLLRAKYGLEQYPARWPHKNASTDHSVEAKSEDSEVDSNGNTQKEDGEEMYWGINGVGVRVGNSVDEHGVGHYESSKTDSLVNGNGDGTKINGIDTNGTKTNGTKTNGAKANGSTNGATDLAYVSKLGTDSLVLAEVVSLALDCNLPGLSDVVSFA
jgi:hypothetical protein